MFGGRRTSERGQDDCPDTLTKLDIEAQQWTPITPAGHSASRLPRAAALSPSSTIRTSTCLSSFAKATGSQDWSPAICLLLLSLCVVNLIREQAISSRKICSRDSINCGLVITVSALAAPYFGAVHCFKARQWQPVSSNTWIVGSPTSIANHTMVTGSDSFIYLFGGQNTTTGSFTNGLLLLDVNQTQWTPIVKCEVDPLCNAPSPRHSHTMVAVDDNLYMFGGRISGGTLPASRELWRMSTTTFIWTQLQSRGCTEANEIPDARYGHTMALVGTDMLYVYGGWIYDQFGNIIEDNSDLTGSSIWAFNISSMCWNKHLPCRDGITATEPLFIKPRDCPSPQIAKANMPGRTAHAMASVGHFIYMYGGCHHAHFQFKQDPQCTNPDLGTACQPERQGALTTTLNDGSDEWMCTLYPELAEHPDSTKEGLYMYRFDTTNNEVSLLDETSVTGTPSHIHVRYGHTMTAIDSDLFVYGGTVHQVLMHAKILFMKKHSKGTFKETQC